MKEFAMTFATRLLDLWTRLAERIYGSDMPIETARGEFISPFITAPPRGERKRV